MTTDHSSRALLPAIVLVIFTIGFGIAGCAGYSKFTISRPVDKSAEPSVSRKGVVSFKGARVTVAPANTQRLASGLLLLVFPIPNPPPEPYFVQRYYWNIDSTEGNYTYTYKNPNFFVLEVLIVAGDKPIAFMPRNTLLRIRDRAYRPENLYELHERKPNRWDPVVELCNSHNYLEDPLVGPVKPGVPDKISLSPNSRLCLALEFSVPPPSPNEPFLVQLGDMSRANEDAQSTHIQYQTDTWVSVHN